MQRPSGTCACEIGPHKAVQRFVTPDLPTARCNTSLASDESVGAVVSVQRRRKEHTRDNTTATKTLRLARDPSRHGTPEPPRVEQGHRVHGGRTERAWLVGAAAATGRAHRGASGARL